MQSVEQHGLSALAALLPRTMQTIQLNFESHTPHESAFTKLRNSETPPGGSRLAPLGLGVFLQLI